MSTFGSYVRISRDDLERCLLLARDIRTETVGRFLWKRTIIRGEEEFDNAWKTAVIEEVEFEHSGSVLHDYITAQMAVNGLSDYPFAWPDARALEHAFRGAVPFVQPMEFPPFEPAALENFCISEYGQKAAGDMVEVIMAAHEFYRRGMAEITPNTSVVFVIA